MTRTLKCLVFSGAGAVLLLFGTAGSAAAHVCMDFPISRVGAECSARSPQKTGPCPVARGELLNVFRPGETITVLIRETVNHPSHYRIAFNPDGEAFADPVTIDDKNGNHPHILLDGIEDDEAANQEIQITFPRITCENCTLQVIQVMYDKQGNGFGGRQGGDNDNDDLYYSCADIALRGEPVAETSASVAEDRGRVPLSGWIGLVAFGLVGATIGGRVKYRRGR